MKKNTKSALIRKYLTQGITSPNAIVNLLASKHNLTCSHNLVHVVKNSLKTKTVKVAGSTKTLKVKAPKPANDVTTVMAAAIEQFGRAQVVSAINTVTKCFKAA